MLSILCRYGELFLKSGNRGFFLRAMADNVRRAVRDLPDAKVSTPYGRILVRVPDELREDACARLERVFGLVSLSPGVEAEPEIAAITATAVSEARAAIARRPELGRSFKVEARRANKQFPTRSHDINCHVGGAVKDALGLPVDVHKPGLRLGIEVHASTAYVFAEIRPAPGGLPVGVSGRGLLLLSGGIDSPVAGWLAAKRGLALEALTFHSPPFTGERAKDKVVSLLRVLSRWQVASTLRVAHFTDTQQRLREAGPADLAVVLYRRMMVRVASLLCERTRCSAIVTGENLGQVASQTLPNMATIEQAARHLVLRPLLTYDKMETVALARHIGTYETSSLPYEDCCSLFTPAHPATAATLAEVEVAEAKLDVAKEANEIAANCERIVV
ncbi:MAG: tRNA 4-thiouridine(8) synthase ThiI [Deltaproteobacteria bacterium]|nr:tRNA 4-thiouridine(8) synthase ThiI [Deltaproteobacteria bacterium]